MNRQPYASAALIVALGFSLMGYFIGDGLRNIKTTDRFVNVRGLSERAVTADTARLTISIKHSGNDPAKLFPLMGETQKQVLAFLQQQGLKEDEIEPGQWSTERAEPESLKEDPSLPHYTSSGTVSVATHNVMAVKNAYKSINDLRVKTNGGVAEATIAYSFVGLGPLRAEMIAAATKDARNAALQFAKDSGSKVGSIRSASQGIFQITAPGQETDDPQSIAKNVRVVTTVDYQLND